MVFPADQVARSRHERVFPMGLSAHPAWRAVQAAQHSVLKAIATTPRRAGSHEDCYTNARWMVLAAVFSKVWKTGSWRGA